jgi:glycosyltransferase involved in cell wall biosynthesis
MAKGKSPVTLLSVCIPTYERPDMLERALRSVVATSTAGADLVEILVSDNSSTDESETVSRKLLDGWPGPTRYHRNVPNVGMVGNFNRCVELSTGDWVLILHDDDYLLPDGLAHVIAGIARAEHTERAILFGARVVNERGRLLRPQGFRRERCLSPREALHKLLSQSSFVRFPAVVVHRQAYEELGGFRDKVAAATDVDMWVRVVARYGLRLVPATTVAYVVHSDAGSMGMFNETYVTRLMTIFDDAVEQGVLSEAEVRQAEVHWFHQFILAGTFRKLRAGDRAGARQIFDLFQLEEVAKLGRSWRWWPLRVLFGGIIGRARTS